MPTPPLPAPAATSIPPDAGRAGALLARMSRVPFSRWYMKARLIMSSTTFFDAFDALSLAFALQLVETRGRSLEEIVP